MFVVAVHAPTVEDVGHKGTSLVTAEAGVAELSVGLTMTMDATSATSVETIPDEIAAGLVLEATAAARANASKEGTIVVLLPTAVDIESAVLTTPVVVIVEVADVVVEVVVFVVEDADVVVEAEVMVVEVAEAVVIVAEVAVAFVLHELVALGVEPSLWTMKLSAVSVKLNLLRGRNISGLI